MEIKKDKANVEWPLWRWIILTLTMAAIILSGILSWHYLTGDSMAGCSGGSPCDQVLSSRWSMLFGILPVSALAVGVYLTLLVTIFFIGPKTDASIRRLAWSVMLLLAGSIAGSAIWFTVIQKWMIGEFCVYCMTTHTTGFVLSLLIIWQGINKSKLFRPLKAFSFALIGLIPAGAVATIQTVYTPPSVHVEGETQDNTVTIDYYNSPIVGSPDADYIVNLIFDYQCPHCQRLHFLLDEAINQYKGKLAFALCPAPLNNACNPYIPPEADAYKNSCELTRISLAVWLANRDLFSDFDTWMFSFETGRRWQPKTPEAARAKAIEMVGKDEFEAAISNSWIDEYIQASVEIYGETIQDGNRGVPRMIYNSNWVIPEPYDVEDILKVLQENLNIPIQ